MRRTGAIAVAAVTLAGIVACSGGGSSSASGTTSSAATSSGAAVCRSADQVRSSLAGLKEVQVVQEGTDAVRAAFGSVRDDLTQLADDAHAQFSAQSDAVRADTDAVGPALDAAQAAPSPQTLGALASAVGVLVRDATALVDDVEATC